MKNQVFYKIIAINILVTVGTIKIIQAHERVIIRSIPEIVYIKENRRSQLINVRFYLENKTRYILEIKQLSLNAFNVENQIILNKQLDLNETRSDISDSDIQKLVKGVPIYYNNPFTSFSPDLELHKLVFQFTFMDNQTLISLNEKIEIYPEYPDIKRNRSLKGDSTQSIISNKSIHKILNKGIQLFSCLSFTNSK